MPSGPGKFRRAPRGPARTAVRRVRLWFHEGNCFMSIKSKVLAAAATLTMVGGLGAAAALTAGTASAATPSCGQQLHQHLQQAVRHASGSPNFVMDVWRQAAKVGQPIILFRTSNCRPGGGLHRLLPGHGERLLRGRPGVRCGQLPLLAAPGLPTTRVRARVLALRRAERPVRGRCHHRPPGRQGRLSAAVRRVRPRPCGSWTPSISILARSTASTPLINGSDTNFSHPFVLTYPKNGYPTDIPRPQLTVTNLTGFSQRSSVPIVGTSPRQPDVERYASASSR